MAPQPVLTKSTGPRTEAGKAASSQNSLRHGLASGTILIPGEDPAEFQALTDALIAAHKPADVTQTLLVADLAKHHWLKDRALRLQGEALALATPGEIPASFPVLLRYQTTNDRAFYKALQTLQALQLQAKLQAREFASQKQAEIEYDVFYGPNRITRSSPAPTPDPLHPVNPGKPLPSARLI